MKKLLESINDVEEGLRIQLKMVQSSMESIVLIDLVSQAVTLKQKINQYADAKKYDATIDQ